MWVLKRFGALSPKSQSVLLALAALTGAVLILNRWIIAGNGTAIFGRVWQYFISYEQVGFVRRGLVGTLMSLSGANGIFDNPYMTAYLFHHIAILIFATLLVWGLHRQDRELDLITRFAVLCSPTTIVYFGFDTGTQDIVVVILAMVNLLFVRGLLPFCLIMVAGILVHELFVLTLPAQFCGWYLRRYGRFDLREWAKGAGPAIAVAVLLLGVVWLVRTQGVLTADQETFEAAMAQTLGPAANKHMLWSGYFELSHSIDLNLPWIKYLLDDLWAHKVFIAGPLIYLGLLLIWAAYLTPNKITMLAIVGVSTLPVMTQVVAVDFYRWVCVSAIMALLLITILSARYADAKVPSAIKYAACAFVLLAPFGKAGLGLPYPVHQILLGKFL